MGEDFVLGPVLLLGAPGVGKGTQAKALENRFRVPHISTGDILRHQMALNSPLGQTAKALVNSGQLVPDNVVNKMVEFRLQSGHDITNGFVLDGYPRTVEQANSLDNFLLASQATIHSAADAVNEGSDYSYHVVAISVCVEYTRLLRRITGRRTCPACGTIYNVYFQPAKVAGICDLDGTALITRNDDTEAVFAERMRTFTEQTAAVVGHYKGKGRLTEVNGDQPVDQVTAQVIEAIRRMRLSKGLKTT